MCDFIQNRLNHAVKEFTDPIPKPKFLNFASSNQKAVTKKDHTTKSLNIDREIFSRLIVIAQVKEIDIASILSYELSPVPLALFYLSGDMRKNTKSDMMKAIENGIKPLDSLPAEMLGTAETFIVIDFMMLIQMMATEKDDSVLYEDLSNKILNIVLSFTSKYTAVV